MKITEEDIQVDHDLITYQLPFVCWRNSSFLTNDIDLANYAEGLMDDMTCNFKIQIIVHEMSNLKYVKKYACTIDGREPSYR